MTRFAFIIAGVLVTLGLGVAPARAAEGPIDPVEQGMNVFADQKCSMCHSVQAKGNKKGPLDGVGSKLTADEIKQWIVDPKTMAEKTKAARKPAMKVFSSLPADDLAALVAYLQTLTK